MQLLRCSRDGHAATILEINYSGRMMFWDGMGDW
jgi:hypothetical protein